MNSYVETYHSGLSHKEKERRAGASTTRTLPPNLVGRQTMAIWLETTAYRPSHKITIRTSVDGPGRDVFGIYEGGFWKFAFNAEAYPGGFDYHFMLDGCHRMKGGDFSQTGPEIYHIPGLWVKFAENSDTVANFNSLSKNGSPCPTGLPVIPNSWRELRSTDFEIRLHSTAYSDRLITVRAGRYPEDPDWQQDVHGVYKSGFWRFKFPAAFYNDGFEFKFVLDKKYWMMGENLRLPGYSAFIVEEKRVRFSPAAPRFHAPVDRLPIHESETQQALLAKSFDSRKLFDVIIVGSGMGGGTLADALSNRGIETLVLEAGPVNFRTHIYNSPGSDLDSTIARTQVGSWEPATQKDFPFGDEISMNLGGRSVFWSGIIPRMQNHELAQWPANLREYLSANGAGYPAAEKLMRKFVTFGQFEEELLGKLNNSFAPDWEITHTPRAEHQPQFDSTTGKPVSSFLVKSSGVFSTAELLLDSLSRRGSGGRDHLHINPNHFVTELHTQNNQITRLICEDLEGGVRREFRAKYYILAAGSMESPRIAMGSGLGATHPLIGRGFTDHPSYFVGYKKEILIPENNKVWNYPCEHARIYFYPKSEKYPFNIEVNFNGRFWNERHADNHIQQDNLENNPRTTVNFKFPLSQTLNENNYLEYQGPDKKLKVHFGRNPEPAGIYEKVTELCEALMTFFGIPDIDLKKGGEYVEFGSGGTPHHAGGSLRMGRDRSEGVVDTDLKFHDLDNLYACDPSVYPMIPAANPSLTLVALALRLADHLENKLKHPVNTVLNNQRG